MKSLFHAGFGCLLGLMTSCSDSSSDSKPAVDSTQIGAKGGLVSQDEASVDVPEGALSSPAKIGVAVSNVHVALPEGYVLAGPAIAFTPHGLTFDVPVTLTLPYSSSSEQLAVLRLEDEQDSTWDVLEGGKFSKGSATLDVTTFSIYAVAAQIAPSEGSGGAGGMSEGGGSAMADAGAANENAGAPGAGGAPTTVGDLSWSCDRTDTDGNGLRICSEYFYPAAIAELLGDKLVPGCPGAGNGILGDGCDTSDAVVGCLTHDVDDIPGVNVTNWFYMGTKEDLMNGVLCTEAGTEFIDPP
jgi:hypothetical protein